MTRKSRLARLALAACAVLACFTTGACSYSVHEVYIGSMDPGVTNGRGHWVEVETKQFVILGFEFGSEYVDKAYKELEGKCSGRLAQVTTEHLTAYNFLSYDQKVVLKGLCLG